LIQLECVRQLARADVGETRWQPCAEQAAVAAKGSRGGGVGTLKILRSKRNDGKKLSLVVPSVVVVAVVVVQVGYVTAL